MQTAVVWEVASQHKRILVEGAALQTMDRYRQDRDNKAEAGGILLGYRKGTNLHVVQATVPQPTDRRKRFRFDRLAHRHQQIALEQWSISGGTIDYIGDWHTHPEIDPTPSNLDIKEWAKVTNRLTKPMVFMIVGITGRIWFGLSVDQHLIKCIKLITDEN